MTREEAIKLLNKWGVLLPPDADEALDMAIEALNCSEIPNGSTLKNLTKPNKNCEVDLISRQDAIDAFAKWRIKCALYPSDEICNILKSLPSAEPLVLTCDGCRHVGTYDTDFPCSGCIRREKDYYEQER